MKITIGLSLNQSRKSRIIANVVLSEVPNYGCEAPAAINNYLKYSKYAHFIRYTHLTAH